MTQQDGGLQYRRLRAPQRHGETFLAPSLADATDTLAGNRRLARRQDGELLGISRSSLVESARRDLLKRAIVYTSAYRDDVPVSSESPRILLTGHQPQLFHPGVWFKNFVAWQLATRCHATAVHLLIDNDTLDSPTIRVPTGSVSSPGVQYLEFDRTTRSVPFEERQVVDAAAFESFPHRVERALERLLHDPPLLSRCWPAAVSSRRRGANLGQAVAEARHRIERDWGVTTLELPFSRVCESNAFRQFAVFLLSELPRLVEVYNSGLLEYRRVHRIRSRSHPVPELARQADWLEAPFWIWSHDDPRRRRLFARQLNGEIELTDRGDQRLRLPLSVGSGGAEAAVQRLAEASAAGCRIRSRALTTTMYARLFLGDYFLHGIGGAKYDQLTDLIIQRFFGWVPPAFGIATATVKLPIERPDVEPSELRGVERQLRELLFHPERFVPATAEARRLMGEKQRWIATELPRGERGPRHRGIVEANQALQAWLGDQRAELCRRRDQLRSLLRSERILGSREFSFCLFPARTLRAVLLDF